jgi:carboxypeptidase Taq
MKDKGKALAQGLIVLQSIVYGFGDPISKIAFDAVPVYAMMTVRYSIAFAVCFLLFRKRITKTIRPVTLRAWLIPGVCIGLSYLLNNVASAILSTVHEVGHATYEHDCDDKYDGMILSEGISSGMHESQSRLFENYLGRSYAFWEYLFPILQKHFPAQLGNVTAKQFTDAVNVSRRSLVRTEADELTYPLHILVRYEIEKGLFDGSISTEGLDETWNALYEKYLGIKVPGAREGILQDVHWSDGSFGYFPTYALGSAFSAQFTAKMREEIDVDEALRSGHFEICIEWLKEHIHKYGCRYDADDIMKIATGREFDVNVYLDYLEEKYTKLYHLK